MRNPLNSIISNCFLLEEDDSLGKYVKMRLKTMRISCNLLTSFLHDLIDWTQIKLDRFNKKAESFDLKSTFEDITEMMRFKAELKNIYCKTEFDPNLPKKVIGDNQRLMQVLINLISNALKFTFMGGVLIKVKYEYDHKKLFVEIIDTGEGIKKENQKKMFKLFQTFGGKA
jgi:signal transduction histidine kinase